MNMSRFILSAIAGFIFIFVYEWGVHGHLLMGMYEATSELWRSQEEMKSYFHWMLISQLLFVLVFTALYTRNANSFNLKEGAVLGLYLGLLMAVISIGCYAYMPIPAELALAWVVSAFVEGLGLGVIIGALYKKA